MAPAQKRWSVLVVLGALWACATAGAAPPPPAGDIGPLQKALLRPLGLYPPETRLAILDIAPSGDLIADMVNNRATYDKGLIKALSKYPARTRAAARELYDSPEVLEILNNFPKYTKLIGAIHAQKPAEVEKFVMSMGEKEAAAADPVDEGDADAAAPPESSADSGSGSAEPASSDSGASSSGEPAPSSEAVPESYCPTPTEEECVNGDPVAAQQLQQIYQLYPQYAGLLVESEELMKMILNDYEQYMELAAALLEYAEAVPIAAVQQWVAEMEQALGAAYHAGQAVDFLEQSDLVKKFADAKGDFWKNAKAREFVQDHHDKYPELAGKVLEEHGKNAIPGVEDWKKKIAAATKLPFDAKNPKAFTELAAAMKKNPALTPEALQSAMGLDKILGNAHRNPSASKQFLQGGANPQALGEWKTKNPKQAGTLAAKAARTPNPSQGLKKMPTVTPQKKAQVSKASASHKSSWTKQSKPGGIKPGGGHKPGK